jgi:hypothetical protein
MISTNNIYYAAFLFSESLTFCGSSVTYDPTFGPTVIFKFKAETPEDENLITEGFANDKATVNVKQYLESLGLVRDITSRMMNQHKLKHKRSSRNPHSIPELSYDE